MNEKVDCKPKRKIYLDFLRIIAIFMVLFNHTGTSGFVLFTVTQHSALYPFYLFNAILIKLAVPLFFMISGVLLLGKEEKYSLVIKRFFKFGAVMLAASFLIYLYHCFRLHISSFSIKSLLAEAYQKPISSHLWYLYAYLAFILMLPFSRKLARHMDRGDFKWMIILFGCFQLLSILEYIVFQRTGVLYSRFTYFISVNYLFYPLLGYYLGCVLPADELRGKHLLYLIIASVFAVSLCAIMTHYKCRLSGEWAEAECQTFFNTLIFLPGAAVFYGVRLFFLKHPPGEKAARFISKIGGATFGLYLIERICRVETRPVFTFLNQYIPTILACWIWIFAACTVGILITLLLKLIPGISKVI